jgi:hypothetical protein
MLRGDERERNPPYLSAACAEGPRRDRGARMGCARCLVACHRRAARDGQTLARSPRRARARLRSRRPDQRRELRPRARRRAPRRPWGVGPRPRPGRDRLLRAQPDAGSTTPARQRGGGRDDGGTELALGAFLDGVPEQLVLGIGVATGEGVSVSLLVAIFVQPPGGDRLVRRDARRGDPTGGGQHAERARALLAHLP